MNFTSDNAAGVAPEVLDALTRAADGHAWPYGADDLTEALQVRVREVFEAPDALAFPVATGTAANALALATLAPPWSVTWCHEQAHVIRDELGAVTAMSGATLSLTGGSDAKIDPKPLAQRVAEQRADGVHHLANGALSLTQATERGAVYKVDEVTALGRIARDAGMPVHMDGARFSNAVERLGCAPADLTWRAGVDVLCLGATKCGAMAAEAVIFFDPARAETFVQRRKRAGHLFSKMRYVSAQMLAWLEDGLWLRLASHANAMADRLAGGVRSTPGCRVLHPVGANMVFAEMPLGAHRRLRAAGAAYYDWPEGQDMDGPEDGPLSVRLVCSFATTEAEIDRFVEILAAC